MSGSMVPPNQGNPSVDDIPDASQLHAQLSTLNQAISVLQMDGASILSFTANPPPPPPPPTEPSDPNVPYTPEMPPSSVLVILDPPITDEDTLAVLIEGLQIQSNKIKAQLAGMGFAPTRV